MYLKLVHIGFLWFMGQQQYAKNQSSHIAIKFYILHLNRSSEQHLISMN